MYMYTSESPLSCFLSRFRVTFVPVYHKASCLAHPEYTTVMLYNDLQCTGI